MIGRDYVISLLCLTCVGGIYFLKEQESVWGAPFVVVISFSFSTNSTTFECQMRTLLANVPPHMKACVLHHHQYHKNKNNYTTTSTTSMIIETCPFSISSFWLPTLPFCALLNTTTMPTTMMSFQVSDLPADCGRRRGVQC